MSDDTATELAEWIQRAEEALERLNAAVEQRELSETIETIHDLLEIADETEELLREVEITELPEAIEADELAEAIEATEIPDAITEGDASEMIDLRALIKAVQLRDLWNSVDVTEFMEEKDELEEEYADFTEGEDADLMDDDDIGEDVMESMDADSLQDLPSSEIQEMIQSKALTAIENFREGVVEAHEKLQSVREENRDRMRRQHDETEADSRNPTAYSTLPTQRPDIEGSATQLSTVSKTVRHSTAPGFDRIYGNRYGGGEDS